MGFVQSHEESIQENMLNVTNEETLTPKIANENQYQTIQYITIRNSTKGDDRTLSF